MKLKRSLRNQSNATRLKSTGGFKTIAKVVLFDSSSGNVLVIRRTYTDSRRPGQWDIPGGTVEAGETLEAAVIRECNEEVAINIKEADLKLFFTDRDHFNQEDDQVLTVNWLVFYCPVTEQSVNLSFEHEEYKWLSVKEATKLMTYHRYKTVMGIFAESKLNQTQAAAGP